MERSFFLKKRRADFVAGSLSGRVIVAGGLGKDGASQVGTVLLVLGGPLALCMGKRRYWLLGHSLPDLPLYSKKFKNTPFLPAWTSCVHVWAPHVVFLSSYTGETEAQKA